MPITINLVTKENVIRDTMERVNEILNLEGRKFSTSIDECKQWR